MLAGLMVAGRVGSGIAAQLGSMRVTEQIDALNTLGTDPIKKLVTPRVLAALIMLPVLTVINDFVGILGGNLIAHVLRRPADGALLAHGVGADRLRRLHAPLHPERLHPGARRSRSCSAASSRITACYFGLKTTGGTEGVGHGTTRTVVTASILILVVDYFLTQILLSVLVA